MASIPKHKFVHTINNEKLGFMYEPGATMRANGIEARHISLGPEEVLLTIDEANIAISRFNGLVVYGRTK